MTHPDTTAPQVTAPAQPPSASDDVEVTRLGALYSRRSIVFVALSTFGILLGMCYIFSIPLGRYGIPIGGDILLEGQYYWLFIGIFGAASYIALPAYQGQTGLPFYDIIAAVVIFGLSVWVSTHAIDMISSAWSSYWAGILIYLLMVELARRGGGTSFVIVVLVLSLVPLIADHLPGLLMGIPYDGESMIEAHVFRAEGMGGVTTKIVAEVILGFLVFAGVLIGTGAGAFFIDLANAGFGKYRGGPAKVAIVASSFFGSLSGSIFSNIAGTGSITIPTMKRVGYPPRYAAAIEACASTGGAVMPPVMGAIAFVMAINIGVDYATIMLAAIIPSLLYYLGLFLQVDAYAVRAGLKGMDPSVLPRARAVMKRGWPFLSVLVFLIWGLLWKRWEYYSPWYASALMIGLSFIDPATRLTPHRAFVVLRQIGILIAQTAAIILPVAFIVSALTITGITGSMTSGLILLGGGNLYLIIFYGMLACFIMGMAGLAIVAYIFLSVTLAPAIIEIGNLNTVAVHFFIVYYAILAVITPPVGGAAFLAATMAGAKPMATSFTAMRLGIVIYIVPLFFLFQPALLLQGDLVPLIWLLPSIIAGITLLAGGLEGYLAGCGRVRGLWRLPLVIAGFAVSFPSFWSTLLGGLVAAGLVFLIRADNRADLPAGDADAGTA